MTPETYHLIFQVLTLVSGLCAGSFANVCIARMPEDRSVVRPRSQCPSCGHMVRAQDNVPLLSWAVLRGRCRDCEWAIPIRYPAVEALVGVLSLLLFRHLVPAAEFITGASLTTWALYLVFLTMLVATTFIDLRHYIIPDEFSIWAIPAGVAATTLLNYLGQPGIPDWKSSLLGALLGGGILAAVMGGYWLIRREEGMGFGDVKLLAMLGAWLGALPAVPVIILLSSIAGSIIGILMMFSGDRGLRSQIPFGPFLALGGVA
ncbi:MAG: prepilin peptidase, partial [Myxococcota bacterium]|nr:prepilin peptidase [Myxococcota bacterium]